MTSTLKNIMTIEEKSCLSAFIRRERELALMRWDDDKHKGFQKRCASKKHAEFYVVVRIDSICYTCP